LPFSYFNTILYHQKNGLSIQRGEILPSTAWDAVKIVL